MNFLLREIMPVSQSPDSMKYFEVEESESNKRQYNGESKPAIIDVIPENHHRTYLIPDSDMVLN